MVNKPNLSLVIDRFQAEQQRQRDLYNSLRAVATNDAMREQSCNLVMVTARDWERFLSDWHIAAVARDSTTFSNTLTDHLSKAVTKYGNERDTPQLSVFSPTVHVPAHPTLSDIASALDGQGRNLPLSTKKARKKFADAYLAAPYASKHEELADEETRLQLDVLLSVRNVIAHRSRSSLEVLNAKVTEASKSAHPDVGNLGRDKNRVSPSGVGSYLDSAVYSPKWEGVSRALLLSLTITELAERLR